MGHVVSGKLSWGFQRWLFDWDLFRKKKVNIDSNGNDGGSRGKPNRAQYFNFFCFGVSLLRNSNSAKLLFFPLQLYLIICRNLFVVLFSKFSNAFSLNWFVNFYCCAGPQKYNYLVSRLYATNLVFMVIHYYEVFIIPDCLMVLILLNCSYIET